MVEYLWRPVAMLDRVVALVHPPARIEKRESRSGKLASRFQPGRFEHPFQQGQCRPEHEATGSSPLVGIPIAALAS